MNKVFDYVVVGTGISSLGILKKIELSKKNILILESNNPVLKKNFKNPIYCEENLPVPIMSKRFSRLPFLKIMNYKSLGGNSNYWGGYCCRYDKDDILNWPIKISDLEKYYNEAEKILNIQNKKKKRNFKLLNKKNENINILNSAIAKNKSELFNSGKAIIKLTKNKKKINIFFGELKKFKKNNKSNLFELDISNTPKKIHCRKLILCTGVYNTEQILKKSNLKFKFNKTKQAQSFVVPVLLLKKTPKKLDLQIIEKFKKLNLNFYLEIKKNPDLISQTIKKKNRILSKIFPKILLNQLAVIWGFIPSKISYDYTIKENGQININNNNLKKKKFCLKFLNEVFYLVEKKLSIKIIKEFLQINQFARSYHLGCNIPMSTKTKKYITVNVNGEVNHKNFKNLYVCSSSIFPNLPSKSYGLTLLANSLRIGELLK